MNFPQKLSYWVPFKIIIIIIIFNLIASREGIFKLYMQKVFKKQKKKNFKKLNKDLENSCNIKSKTNYIRTSHKPRKNTKKWQGYEKLHKSEKKL